MRSEIASVVIHISGYGNAIVNGRERNQWLKSIGDHYYGFSEQQLTQLVEWRTFNPLVVGSSPTLLIAETLH